MPYLTGNPMFQNGCVTDVDLSATTVVVAGSARTVGRLGAGLRRAGAAVVESVVLRSEPGDPDQLAGVRTSIGDGEFRWIVVTSSAAVAALDGAVPPPGTDVVAVGDATAEALRDAGIPVAWVPRDQSAAGVLAEWEASAGPVLLPQSDLADPLLADGLRARGHEVTVVEAYRTVTLDPPAAAADALADPATVLVVTSPSAVSALRACVVAGPVVAIGERTGRAAGMLGSVTVADRPDADAVALAVLRAAPASSP